MDFLKRLLLGGAVLGLAAVLTTGCTPKEKKPATTTATTAATTVDKGPKGSEDYLLFHTKDESHHVRLKLDRDKKLAEATIYDGENKEIKPIEAETLTLNVTDNNKAQIVLKAQPSASDPKGKSSVFIGEHERLSEDITPEKTEIAGKIGGKNYAFELDKEHGK
jgi:hypothetical protein